MMRKSRHFSLAFLLGFMVTLLTNNVFAVPDYTVKLLPLAVEPSTVSDETKVSGTFKLFKDSSAASDIASSDFSVYEDSIETTSDCDIRAPETSAVRMADFVFVIDITGSMGSEITGVKNSMTAFADGLKTSGIDYRLSMVTFRDDVIVGGSRNPSGGAWTADAEQFKTWTNSIALGWGADWPEASFDAVGRAADFSTRDGAQRIIVLFTDADSHVKGDTGYTDPTGMSFIHTQTSLIAKLKAKGFITYVAGPSNTQFRNAGSITTETGGRWYSIRSSISSIMDDIRTDIANQYAFYCLTTAAAGLHNLEIGIAKSDYATYRSNPQPFLIGAAPVVNLTDPTRDLVVGGFHSEGTALPVSVSVSDDAAPLVNEVKLYYRKAGTVAYTDIAMTKSTTDSTIYEVNIPDTAVEKPAIEFYAWASDGERGGFTPHLNAISHPWNIAIVNHPPKVGACTPEKYDVDQDFVVSTSITDVDGDAISATLYYKAKGSLTGDAKVVMTESAGSFTATIPAKLATAYGVEAYIIADDGHDGTGKGLCTFAPNEIPVDIISMTHQENTTRVEGPYPIRAIALAADEVTLHYTVNGGAEQTMNMPESVRATRRARPSNIYFADIPGQAAGSTVSYFATAKNATTLKEARYPEGVFTFKVMPVPEAMAVTPDTLVLAPSESAEILGTGCYGAPYNWTSSAGDLSTTTGEKTKVTAKEIPGIYSVRAEDPAGVCAATAKVQIIKPLDVNPASANLKAGNSMTFMVSGGEAPYSWTVSEGSATMVADGSGKSAVVTASSTDSGSVTLTVTDKKGRTATASVTTNGPLVLDPSGALTMALGGKQAFNVTGGTAPYSWEVIGGNLDTNEGASVNYEVPTIGGAYTVSVTDSATNTDSVLIIAGTPLLVTPLRATIALNETAIFDVTGGVAPYRWVATEGNVTPIEGAQVTYTPPSKTGIYQLEVYDAAGTVLAVEVEVSSATRELIITPTSANLKVNGNQTLTAVGGKAPYTWNASKGTLSATEGTTVTYTAPAQAGDYTATVTDATGKESTAELHVGDLGGVAIIPAAFAIQAGKTRELVAKGGNGDYSWKAGKGTLSATTGEKVTYTAPANISEDTITVSSDGKDATTKVYVTSAIADMSITPANVNLAQGATQTFVVNNAAKVKWSATGGSITDAGVYTAPASGGNYTVSATDYRTGRTVTANVAVSAQLSLTPSQASIKTTESTTFAVSGGEAPYTWLVEGEGKLNDTTGASVTFTAGINSGIATVRVTDNKGMSGKAEVTVKGDTVLLTPQVAWLDLNGSTSFSVNGGVAPYTWSADAGTISNSGQYTASNAFGDVMITVKDSAGKEGYAKVYVDLELMPTRAAIYLGPSETAKVAVVGGLPPFEWQASTGEMESIRTDDAGYNNYTAPKEMGETAITVRDRKGNTTTIKVNVVQPLGVTPLVRYMKKGGERAFTVVTGVAPFTAIAEKGDIVADNPTADNNPDSGIVVSKDGKFTYTAPDVADEDVVITFTDNRGQEAKVHAYVERKLRVSPTTLFVDKDGTIDFKVVGGTGGFFITADQGQISDIDEETGKGTYTAPRTYGTYTLTLSDSSDQEITFMAEVARMDPQISPAVANIPPGGTRVFMVTRGSGEYIWNFTGGSFRALNDAGTMVEVTAPAEGGTYELVAEDKAGNLATATVTVVQSLMISPASYAVYKGENAAVRFNKLGGTGKCDWVLDGITEVEKGDNYVVIRPRTDVEAGTSYQVGCRDQSGEMAQASVVVTTLAADMDGDGKINDDEAEAGIDTYFNEGSLNGVTIDKSNLFLIIEQYQSTTLSIQ